MNLANIGQYAQQADKRCLFGCVFHGLFNSPCLLALFWFSTTASVKFGLFGSWVVHYICHLVLVKKWLPDVTGNKVGESRVVETKQWAKKKKISEALKTKAAVPVVNKVSEGMAVSEFEGWGVLKKKQPSKIIGDRWLWGGQRLSLGNTQSQPCSGWWDTDTEGFHSILPSFCLCLQGGSVASALLW